eukprot:gene5002-6228_t
MPNSINSETSLKHNNSDNESESSIVLHSSEDEEDNDEVELIPQNQNSIALKPLKKKKKKNQSLLSNNNNTNTNNNNNIILPNNNNTIYKSSPNISRNNNELKNSGYRNLKRFTEIQNNSNRNFLNDSQPASPSFYHHRRISSGQQQQQQHHHNRNPSQSATSHFRTISNDIGGQSSSSFTYYKDNVASLSSSFSSVPSSASSFYNHLNGLPSSEIPMRRYNILDSSIESLPDVITLPPLPLSQSQRLKRSSAMSRNQKLELITPDRCYTSYLSFLRYVFLNINIAFSYVHKNSKRNKKNALVGMICIFLVVFFISFFQNLIQISPIVVMKMAENQVGEADLILTPKLSDSTLEFMNKKFGSDGVNNSVIDGGRNSSSLAQYDYSFLSTLFLNSTYLSYQLEDSPSVRGVAPRWMSFGTVNSSTTNNNNVKSTTNKSQRDHSSNNNKPTTNSSLPINLINQELLILVIDSQLEKDIGLGRGWNHRPLYHNQIHVTNTFLERMGILPNSNEKLDLHLDLQDAFEKMAPLPMLPNADDFNKIFEGITGVPIQDSVSIHRTIPSLVVKRIKKRYGNDVISDDGKIIYPKEIVNYFYKSYEKVYNYDTTLVVIDSINSPNGKYPAALGNVGVLESSFVERLIKDNLKEFADTLSISPELEFFLGFLTDAYPSNNLTKALDTFDYYHSLFLSLSQSFELDEYSMSTVIMMNSRVDVYTSDQKDMKSSIGSFTDEVSDCIGFDFPTTFTVPMALAIQGYSLLKTSLNQLFLVIVVLLFILGGLLIYTLLITDVEAKTYEYGMLRAQGMRHYSLITIILTQALYFSIPGILFGLFFGWVLYAIVARFIYQYVYLPVDLSFYMVSILSGILMGIFMPIFANVVPIQRALLRTLRDALDLYRQAKNETLVIIQKLDDVGIDLFTQFCSLFVIVTGFNMYYTLPMTYVYQKFDSFFGILTFVLVGTLLGLALIAQSIQPWVQKLFTMLIVWGRDRILLYPVVKKNLYAHSIRNTKTTTLLTISITFIIFTGSIFSLQGNNIQQMIKMSVGSDISVQANSLQDSLPEDTLRSYLEQEVASGKSAIDKYTFVSVRLNEFMTMRETRITSLFNYRDYMTFMYALESNFLEATYLEFYDCTEINELIDFPRIPGTNKPDIVKSLYVNNRKSLVPEDRSRTITPPPTVISADSSFIPSEEPKPRWYIDQMRRNFPIDNIYFNYTDIILPESFRGARGVTPKQPIGLFAVYREMPTYDNFVISMVKVQSMVKRMPGFKVSSYADNSEKSPSFISMDQFQYLVAQSLTVTSINFTNIPSVPPKGRLLIKLKPGTSKLGRESVLNGLNNRLNASAVTVSDTYSLIENTSTAIRVLDTFFYMITAIVLVLSFFMLWVSFSANIHESSWEFGVLRSIGLTSNQVARIYFYESVILILTSIFLGLLLGLGIALTLTLQLNLFTEMPFSFKFPYVGFGLILIISFGIACIVSYHATYPYRHKQIASILKGK